MATFVWPPEVQWPPPANILLNYDVAPPSGVLVEAQGVLRSVDVAPTPPGGHRVVIVTSPGTAKEKTP